MTKQITLVLAVVVTVALVSSGRKPTPHERSEYLYRSLWKLKAKIKTCTGKFMCDLQTTSRSCDMNCIGLEKLCDGHDDCSDKVDEMGCPPKPSTSVPTTTQPPCQACEARQITCDNGNCVSISDVCDGEDDCNDQSDEEANCGCLISTDQSLVCVELPPVSNLFGRYLTISGTGDLLEDCAKVCQVLPACQGIVQGQDFCGILMNATVTEMNCTDGPGDLRFFPCIESAN